MNTLEVEIGKRIKSRRAELGLTLEQLADTLGFNKSTMHRYEVGQIRRIKLPIIQAIASALKVNPDWLILKSDEKDIKATIEEQKNNTVIIVEEFNIRLKKSIANKSMKIFELSQKTGISENTLCKYLSGLSSPSKDHIYLLGRTLEVSQSWLMGYDVPMETKYYSASYELSAEEECIISIFRHLNREGQDRLLDYSMELNEISKYKSKNVTAADEPKSKLG